MAFAYSPKIVTDGLVFAVDAANKKSYTSGSSTWVDLAGSNNNGTLINTPGYDTGNGGGITFDMTDEYVSCTNSNSLTITGSSITFEAAFKTNYSVTDGNGNAILSKRYHYTSNGVSFLLWHVQGDYLIGQIETGNGRYTVNSSAVPDINDNIPHIAQVTYNGSTLYMYLDGIQVDSITASGNILNQNVNLFVGTGHWTGNADSRYHFNGTIYYAKIYNKALTSTEITQNYNALKSRFGL